MTTKKMISKLFRVLICTGIWSAASMAFADEAATGKWIDLIDSVDVDRDVVAGSWQKVGSDLQTNASRSSRLTLVQRPKTEYDFRVQFTRTSGVHSIALMFVVNGQQATFEIDAWGQHLAGVQMTDGETIQSNSTRVENQTLENGRKYTAELQVRKQTIRAILDGKQLVEHKIDGSEFSVAPVWQMPDATSLGVGAYESATQFHSIEFRSLPNGQALSAQANKLTTNSLPSNAAKTEPPKRNAESNSQRSMRPANGRRDGTGKRVLLVIANQDFFYREYFDPRQQLERAGITVEVAAGEKSVCRPHHNSGQQGNGTVMPDLAIAEADASRYDAIMFSGGWGSSMYQYAFQGSYSNRVYNGDRRTKAAVNQLLNDFIRQDKYVGALCHGVSVLAWARVDGQSILNGKRAVGSPRQSPSGIYNGQRGQPLSRWNAEVNGARLSPARSIGNPQTSADDVAVDGKIITGEDDNSAAAFGEALARLLNSSASR